MTSTRPLIIGMNNPLSVEPEYALYPHPEGCTGYRLWQILHVETGATRRDYLRVFERTNLVIGTWNRRAAEQQAKVLLPRLAGRRVVLLGREVQRAFNIPDVPVGEIYTRVVDQDRRSATFYRLPHPSGRNPWYNDESNRRAAALLLARLYREGEDGAD